MIVIRKFRRYAVVLMLALVAPVVLVMQPAAAAGGTYGRGMHYGYFTGTYCNSWNCNNDNVFSSHALFSYGGRLMHLGDVRSTAQFKSAIKQYLDGDAKHNGSWFGPIQEEMGAAFIIDTMLGINGTAFGSASSGISYARSHYSQWESIVDAYDARQGGTSIEIRYVSNWCTAEWDARSSSGNCVVDGLYIPPVTASGGSQTSDDQFFWFQPDAAYAIIFHNADGTKYTVRLSCGNPVGALTSPTIPKEYSNLDGVKIGVNSVSSTGTSSGYGGSWSGQQFSDDKVTVSGVGSSTSNPFYFTNNIPVGKHTVSISATGDTNWTLYGYSICEGSTCTTKWLTESGHMTRSGSFTYNFQADKHYHMRWIFVPKLPGDSGDCPGDVKINASTIVTINLPDNSPNVGPPTSASTYPNARYTQKTPERQMEILGVRDTSNGGARLSSQLKYLPSAGSKIPNSSVNVDYNPFVKNYPYDHNQASVDYQNYYDETYWTSSSSPDYYVCPNGSTTTSSTCYGSVSVSRYSGSCTAGKVPTGGSASGTGWAYGYSSCTAGYNYSKKPPVAIAGYYFWSWYDYCTGGYSASTSGGTFKCVASGSPRYNWHRGSTVKGFVYSEPTAAGYTMNPCWNRGFSVTNATGGNVNFDYPEDPTRATSNGSVSAQIGYADGGPTGVGFRQPLQVNLDYTAVYTFEDSDGNTVHPSLDCSPSGSTTVGTSYYPTTLSSSVSTSCAGLQAPPLEAGDVACVTYTFSPSGDFMDIGGAPQSTNNPRQNDSSGLGNGDSYSSPKACSGPVHNEPYAHFLMNGVAAGGAFDSNENQCADVDASASGKIAANIENLVNGRPLRGSGVQFGAIALGDASQFGSASLRTANPTSPYGLTFSNSIPYGHLGTSMCISNYYQSKATVQKFTAYRGNWSGSLVKDSNGKYYQDQIFTYNGGNLTVPQIPPGVNVVIYASGSLTINSDIAYNTSDWKIKPGTINITNVPSLYVITNSNINIGPDVGQLDGVYVAQGGTIDTCYTHSFAGCSQQLIIYGSFIAKQIDLYRTFASLRDSAAGEYPSLPPQTLSDGPGGQCDRGDNGNPTGTNSGRPGGLGYDCAAELFIFSPANYLSIPALIPTGGPSTGKFDAISSLSPVL